MKFEMNEYFFEGGTIDTPLPDHVMDRLAGIAISYKMFSKDRVTKAAKEQRAFFNGVLCGLEMAGNITPTTQENLYAFFMGE